MSISRLYDNSASDTVLEAEIDGELNQIVSELNLKLDKAGGTVTGALVLSDTFTVGANFKGSRHHLSFPFQTAPSADAYISGASGESSITMPRNGSIVGYSIFSNCSAFTSTYAYQLDIYKNAVSVASSNIVTHSGTGIQIDYDTFSRGTYSFSAGDRIAAFHNVTTSGTATVSVIHSIEVQFDT